MTKERDIETAIIQYLNILPKCFAWKVPDQRAYRNGVYRKDALIPAGQPDVTACINGQIIFIEVKTPSGRLSANQTIFHKRLKSCGGKVFVVFSLQDIKNIVSSLLSE